MLKNAVQVPEDTALGEVVLGVCVWWRGRVDGRGGVNLLRVLGKCQILKPLPFPPSALEFPSDTTQP
jgi:hypothetical protein